MKPYICHTLSKRVCPCCPGHDGEECINKWSGSYKSRASKKRKTAVKRAQARKVRRILKRGDSIRLLADA